MKVLKNILSIILTIPALIGAMFVIAYLLLKEEPIVKTYIEEIEE